MMLRDSETLKLNPSSLRRMEMFIEPGDLVASRARSAREKQRGVSLPALTVAARHHRAEPSLVLRTRDERAHHAAVVAAVGGVQYVQPELVAALLRIAAQIAEVLCQHKARVVLRLLEGCSFNYLAQHQAPAFADTRAAVIQTQQRCSL